MGADSMPGKSLFDRETVRVGVVPTIWTNDDRPLLGDSIPFEQCVSEIALAGYEGTALGHKFPGDALALRRALDLRGLTVCSAWVGTYFTANQMRQQTVDEFICQLKFLKPFGSADLVVAELGHAVHQQSVGALDNKPHFDDRQWASLLAGLNELGRRAADQGMRVAYHPHVGTGVQNRDEIDRLVHGTKDAVTLLLDTAHLSYAGVDPLGVVQTFGERIFHVHLKGLRKKVRDESVRIGRSFLDSIMAGVFTVPGDPENAIDFDPILRALVEKGFHGWLVVEAEQDPARAHPLTYAQMAADFLRPLFSPPIAADPRPGWRRR
jgi:inosose dehydratase